MPSNNKHTNPVKTFKSTIDHTLDLIPNRLKAALITFFISASILMFVFNSGLKQQDEIVSESYYEIDPEKLLTEEQIKELEALDALIASKAETNNAFNETEKITNLNQSYKAIAPPKDFDKGQNNSETEDVESFEKKYEPSNKSKINEEEISSFDKVNELLKKQKEKNNNNKSTISYILKNRTGNIPIPIYLCESSGIVVIQIEVNSAGRVTKASLDKNSGSTNQCLIENALEYAKYAKFNSDASKPTQSGSITYSFIGKH